MGNVWEQTHHISYSVRKYSNKDYLISICQSQDVWCLATISLQKKKKNEVYFSAMRTSRIILDDK